MKLNPPYQVKLCLALIVLSIFNFSILRAAQTPVVDCNCLSNLPIYHVTNCIGIVPDLCSVATSCFSTNYVAGPGLCIQSPGPYTPVSPGTNTIQLIVTDVNSNVSQCTVDFIVTAPPAILSVACFTNKIVPCGTLWTFDTPVATTTCCDPTINTVVLNVVSNGLCPKILTCTWIVSDNCGNNTNCTQTVTVVDTVPPVTQCSGVNLVPNPGFDFYTNCPYQPFQVEFAYPWFNPSMATSDYYNSCSPVGFGVSTPLNAQGTQAPLSGGSYAGAIMYYTFSDPTNSYREYLEVPLLAPLQAGQLYRVAFNVNLADGSGWSVAEIGAYLSVGPIVSNATFTVFNFTPQVENPSYNQLASTNSWMLVQGTFIAAGGEDHLTLGNFHGNANTTLATATGQFSSYAYYYFDDVSVEAICGPDSTNKIVQCGSPIIFDSPLAYDLCSGTNVTVTVTGTVTNNLCPPSVTRSWLLTDLCGNSSTWTQTITAVDTNPPYVLCTNVNLASNAQFEAYSSCPIALDQLGLAAPWFNPTGASPDYFNACATPSSGVSVPVNLLGSQNAFSGQGYAGGIVYTSDNNDFANSYREYVEAPLAAPLVAGQAYLVSVRVNLADISSYAIAEISARFTVGPLTNDAIQTCLPGAPQIINPSANILSSTNNWMLVQGIFVAAGGENHITLGNFFSDQNTTAIAIPGGTLPYAYYFYDSVTVTPLCNWVTNKTIPCGSPMVFDTPYPFDPCSGTNVPLAITTVTNVVCPFGVTRTWTYTNACGHVKSFSQTISVVDSSPLAINCACLAEFGSNGLYTNSCAGIVPDLLKFTNCFPANCRPVVRTQSPPAGTIVGPGTHTVTVSVIDCAGNSNGCALPFTVNSVPPTIMCPRDIVRFTCGTGAVVYYTPVAFGNVGPVTCSPPSGTFFSANLSYIVTCTATNACGQSVTCTFGVTVMRPPGRWSCLTIIGIGFPLNPVGTAIVSYPPPLPGGGLGVDLENLGSSGQDGVLMDIGPAEKVTFSTVLDFNAPPGASFSLGAPPDPGTGTAGETFLTITKSCQSTCGFHVSRPVSDPQTSLRTIGIGNDGELFSSFLLPGNVAGTNDLVALTPAPGVTSAVMTVTLDLHTRELSLDFPECAWTPDLARKGWDGLIYGNAPRGSGGIPSPGGESQGEGEFSSNPTARVIITPIPNPALPSIPTLSLLASNLPALAFDNPAVTTMGRKWGDGHVTLMKAYDDPAGLEFAAFGPDGGVNTDLGNAATFNFRMTHFEDASVTNQEMTFTARGWPPGTTTNRPSPPPIYWRLGQSAGGTNIDCSADFGSFGISNVTLQLWNGSTLISEKAHAPATLGTTLVTLSTLPTIFSYTGLLSLSSTNPFTVLSGLDCPAAGCIGNELRIIPESSPTGAPPAAFGPLSIALSPGMDVLLSGLQTTPACVPLVLNVEKTASGINLTWAADGFHLLGAENVNGPWYDLGVSSPVHLSANHPARYFRLSCD